MTYLLAPCELEHLRKYEEAWELRFGIPARDCDQAFFNLGDNPDNRLTWSAAGRIPGFRKSAGRKQGLST